MQHVPILTCRQVVVAIAQKDEVPLTQPFEQCPALGNLVGIEGGWIVRQLAGGSLSSFAHAWPIFYDHAHRLEHAAHVLSQRCQRGRIALLIDLDVEQRFGARVAGRCAGWKHLGDLALGVAPDVHDRSKDEVDGTPMAAHLHAHRVYQEGHIIGHDLDDRMRALPAVLFEVGCVEPHLCLARRPALDQLPMAHGCAIQLEGTSLAEVFGSSPPVVLADKDFDSRRQVGGSLSRA